jgi:hypothetical protein
MAGPGSRGPPPGGRRPGPREERVLQLAQPETGQPLAEPRPLDGRLLRRFIRRRRRGFLGVRRGRRVWSWFLSHTARHPCKCQEYHGRLVRIVFKDGAVNLVVQTAASRAWHLPPKVLFDRALELIIVLGRSFGDSRGVAAGPQRCEARRHNPDRGSAVAPPRETVAALRRNPPPGPAGVRCNFLVRMCLPVAGGHARSLHLQRRIAFGTPRHPGSQSWHIETTHQPLRLSY